MSEELAIQPVKQRKRSFADTGFTVGSFMGAYAGVKYAPQYQIGIQTKITPKSLGQIFFQKPDFFDKKIEKDAVNKDFWIKAKECVVEFNNKVSEFKSAVAEIREASPKITNEELTKKLQERGLKTSLKDIAIESNANALNKLKSGLGKVKFVNNKWINGAVGALALGVVFSGIGSLFKTKDAQ